MFERVVYIPIYTFLVSPIKLLHPMISVLRVSDITLERPPPRGILRSRRRRRLLGFLLPLLLLARFGKGRLLVVARREKLSF